MVGALLGCEANYSIDVYARPVGHEKQTFQSSAYDYDLIDELNGLTIEEVLDDPLCYDQSQCSRVANHELDIVMAQRKRIRFKKIAHLQDEITDVITVVHPYSGLSHNVMIANLTRTFEIPDTPQADVGFFDSIEGWRLE